MTKQELRQAIHRLKLEIKSTENLIDRELINLETARNKRDYLVHRLRNLNEVTDARQNFMSKQKLKPEYEKYLRNLAKQGDRNAIGQLERANIFDCLDDETDDILESESSIRMSKIGNVAKFPELGLRNKPFELAVNERVVEPRRGGSKYPAFDSVKESFLKQV